MSYAIVRNEKLTRAEINGKRIGFKNIKLIIKKK